MAKKKAKEENIINVDEVYTKTEQFVDKNRNGLTYGLGGIAIVVLAFAGYEYLVQAPANANAEAAIFPAEHYFSKDSIELAQYGDGFSAGLEEIMDDHNEAIGFGVTGVPAARMADSDVAIVGAQPIEIYRRWIERTLAQRAAAAEA